MFGVSSWQEWLWALSVGVQVGLCYLIVRHGRYKQFPFFFFYLISDLVQSALMFLAYRQSGFSSWKGLIVAWSAQAVVTAARGLAVAEVCRNCLRNYQGIWAQVWRILLGVATLVALYAGLAAHLARRSALLVAVTKTVLAANRGVELAIATVLLSLLAFARYYGVPLNRQHKTLAVGFCLFSCVAILNDTIFSVFLRQYASAWNGIETFTYFLVLLAWWRALYRFAPGLSTVPMLGSQTTYDEYAPQFNVRLRLLNDRLMQVLKS